MSRRIVLCRHTQTQHNIRRIYTGQLDIPLNRTGISQANSLAANIAALDGICVVLSSDLQRAAYLANGIGRLANAPVRLLRGLREASVGRLEGSTWAQFPHKYRDWQFQTINSSFDFGKAGGERAVAVIERQLLALRAAIPYLKLSTAPITRVVVVGHGTAFRLLFRDRLQLIDELHEQGSYQEVPWVF